MHGGGLYLKTIQRSDYEPARIQHVFGLKLPCRPPGTCFKLNTEKVADLAKHAITNYADEFPIGITDAQRGLQRNRMIGLHASAG